MRTRRLLALESKRKKSPQRKKKVKRECPLIKCWISDNQNEKDQEKIDLIVVIAQIVVIALLVDEEVTEREEVIEEEEVVIEEEEEAEVATEVVTEEVTKEANAVKRRHLMSLTLLHSLLLQPKLKTFFLESYWSKALYGFECRFTFANES